MRCIDSDLKPFQRRGGLWAYSSCLCWVRRDRQLHFGGGKWLSQISKEEFLAQIYAAREAQPRGEEE